MKYYRHLETGISMTEAEFEDCCHLIGDDFDPDSIFEEISEREYFEDGKL